MKGDLESSSMKTSAGGFTQITYFNPLEPFLSSHTVCGKVANWSVKSLFSNELAVCHGVMPLANWQGRHPLSKRHMGLPALKKSQKPRQEINRIISLLSPSARLQ
jgi:hypothetical protein